MNSILKTIIVLLLDAGLMVYTIANYTSGKIEFPVFVVSVLLVSYIAISMSASLIRELKNK